MKFQIFEIHQKQGAFLCLEKAYNFCKLSSPFTLMRTLFLFNVLLGLSSCGNNFKSEDLSSLELQNLNTNKFNMVGEVKNSKESCFSDGNIDACIFKISPVAQEGSISPNVKFDSDLSQYQKYAVKIENNSGSASLENNIIKVLADGKALNKTSGGNWKYEYKDKESGLKVLQVHNYFHINEIINTFKEIGGDIGIRQQIPIEVHASVECNAYFSSGSSTQEIMIGVCEDTSLAFDADVAMHEFGHAVLHNASGGATSNRGAESCDDKIRVKNSKGTEYLMQKCKDDNHSYYVLSDTSDKELGVLAACSTENGCISGLNEGQADFHVFIFSC